jgi:hypothetical protein
MVGRRSPQNPAISRLTLPPETIPSCSRRMRHTEFQPHSGRHPVSALGLLQSIQQADIYCTDLHVVLVPEVVIQSLASERLKSTRSGSSTSEGAIRTHDLEQTLRARFGRPLPDVPGNRRS